MLFEGSTNNRLNWRFTLTENNLQFVTLKVNNSILVANILPSSGDVTVSQAFTSRVNVTWATGHITLIIFNVSTSEEGVYSCELNAPGILWKSSIKVAVVGKVILFFKCSLDVIIIV